MGLQIYKIINLKIMKKLLIIVALVLVFIAVTIGFWPSISKAATGLFSHIKSSTATTTPEYLIGGTASSTKDVYVGGAEHVDLMVQFTASTSPAVLQWQYEFSNNQIDWYAEDAVLAGPTLGNQSLEHASTTVVHRWLPGSSTASTSRKIVTLPTTGSEYVRVTFSVPLGGVRGAVWTEWNIKTGQE